MTDATTSSEAKRAGATTARTTPALRQAMRMPDRRTTVVPATSPASTATRYRPFIDGLRGVSVCFVVAFHAFPTALRGGFVGVDVFFVISGYLITAIINNGLASGSFSFGGFYARRVNRLFPALLIVCAATFLLGWFYLRAPEFETLGSHLAASAAFGANFIFWHEAGYFDGAAATKPLLHLWSLGIEEQFYLVCPLLLWITHRVRIRPLPVLLVVLAASFALNLYDVAQGRTVADFYSPLSRSWELAVGGILACVDLRRLARPAREACAVLGAALLVLCLGLVEEAVYPGTWALMPVAASALIIAAGEQAWLNRRVLAHRATVAVGLISYPLYLWHWPLLSFTAITETGPPTALERWLAVLVAIGLAVATYRLIERPMRVRGPLPRRRMAVLCSCMLMVLAVGGATRVFRGLWFRSANDQVVVNQGEIGHAPYFAYVARHAYPCAPKALHDQAEVFEGVTRCFQAKAGGPQDVALIGDSHAEDLLTGLAERLPTKNIVSFNRSFGLPLLSTGAFKAVFDHVASDPDIKDVIISADWDTRVRQKQTPSLDRLEADLLETVRFLLAAHKNVDLVDDRPHFGFDAQYCKFASGPTPFWVDYKVRCVMARPAYERQQAPYSSLLQAVVRQQPGVRILHAGAAFCDGATCGMADHGQLFYRDRDHLTVAGSARLGRAFVEEDLHLAQ